MNNSLIDLYKNESANVVYSLDNGEVSQFIDLVLEAYTKES